MNRGRDAIISMLATVVVLLIMGGIFGLSFWMEGVAERRAERLERQQYPNQPVYYDPAQGTTKRWKGRVEVIKSDDKQHVFVVEIWSPGRLYGDPNPPAGVQTKWRVDARVPTGHPIRFPNKGDVLAASLKVIYGNQATVQEFSMTPDWENVYSAPGYEWVTHKVQYRS